MLLSQRRIYCSMGVVNLLAYTGEKSGIVSAHIDTEAFKVYRVKDSQVSLKISRPHFVVNLKNINTTAHI